MTFFADEVITVTDGVVKTLTASKYDNGSGGPKAQKAVLFNHSITNATIGYRFGTDNPVAADYAYVSVAPGESWTVEGYDNLVNLKIIRIGSADAKVFAQYAA